LRSDVTRLESKVKELEDTRVSGRTLSEKLQGLRTDVLQRVELKIRGGSDSL
jgi:ribosomal protein S6E (S10)